jgi:hypothetical protein
MLLLQDQLLEQRKSITKEKDLNFQLTTNVEKLGNNLQKREEELKKRDQTISDQQGKTAALQLQNSELIQINNYISQQNDDLRNDKIQMKQSLLQNVATIKLQTAENKTLKIKALESKVKIKNNKDEHTVLQNEIIDLQKQLMTDVDKIKDISLRSRNLLVETKEEMHEKEKVVASLKSKVNELETELLDLELEKKEEIKDTSLRSTNSMVATKEKIYEKERIIASLKSKVNELEIKRFDLELEKKHECNKHVEEMHQKDESINKVKARIKQLQSLKDLNNETTKLVIELKELQNQNSKLKSISKNENLIEDLHNENVHLKNRNTKLIKGVKFLEESTKILEENINQLNINYQEVVHENERLQQRLINPKKKSRFVNFTNKK